MTWLEAILYLKDRNVDKIIISYEGSGDSGCVEDCRYFNDDDEFNLNDLSISNDFHESIKDLASESLLDKIEDWWNNDGGYGDLVIDLKDNSYTIENNIRYTDYETYNHEGEIKDLFE